MFWTKLKWKILRNGQSPWESTQDRPIYHHRHEPRALYAGARVLVSIQTSKTGFWTRDAQVTPGGFFKSVWKLPREKTMLLHIFLKFSVFFLPSKRIAAASAKLLQLCWDVGKTMLKYRTRLWWILTFHDQKLELCLAGGEKLWKISVKELTGRSAF